MRYMPSYASSPLKASQLLQTLGSVNQKLLCFWTTTYRRTRRAVWSRCWSRWFERCTWGTGWTWRRWWTSWTWGSGWTRGFFCLWSLCLRTKSVVSFHFWIFCAHNNIRNSELASSHESQGQRKSLFLDSRCLRDPCGCYYIDICQEYQLVFVTDSNSLQKNSNFASFIYCCLHWRWNSKKPNWNIFLWLNWYPTVQITILTISRKYQISKNWNTSSL